MVDPINNIKEFCTELEITPSSAAKTKLVLAGKPVEPAKIESKKDLQEYSYIPSAKKVLGVSLLLTAAAGSYYLYTQHPDQVENLNSRFSTLTNKISSQVSNQVSAASKQLTSLNTLASRKLSATGSLVQSAVTSFLAYSSQTYNSFVESVVSPTVVKQPEANQPEANQTAVSPTVANPTAVSPTVVKQPEANQPEANQTAVSPTVANPTAVSPTVVKQPEANQPEANQPVVNQPVVNQPVVNQTVANPTAVSPTVVKQPEANQPVVNQTVVEQPEANQPVVSPTVNVKATVIDRNGIETRKNLSGKRTNEIMKTQEGTKKVRVIHISHRSKPPIKLTKNSSEANLKPSLVGQLMTNLFDLNKFLVIQTSSIIRSTPSYLTYLKDGAVSTTGKLMNEMSDAWKQAGPNTKNFYLAGFPEDVNVLVIDQFSRTNGTISSNSSSNSTTQTNSLSFGKLMNNMSYAREQGLGAAKYTWDYISPMATKVANVTVPCLIPLKKVAVSKAGELMNVTSYAGEQAQAGIEYAGSSISYLASSTWSLCSAFVNTVGEIYNKAVLPKNVNVVVLDPLSGETEIRQMSSL